MNYLTKHLRKVTLLIILVIGNVLYSAETEKITQGEQFIDISSREAYQLLEKNKNNENFIILDVRRPSEYNDGHLAGAKVINFYDPDFKTELNKLDKSKTYFIYCRSGRRTGITKKIMRELGFKSVINLAKGKNAYLAAGYTFVKD